MTTKYTPTRSQMTYAGMLEMLNGKNSRKVQNNTYLVLSAFDGIGVRLHNTEVVTYYPNGGIILDSGGWQTVTTKDRMNTWAPVRVSQTKGEWSVCAISDIQGYYNPEYTSLTGWGEWLRFSDGLPMADGEFYKRSQTVPYVDGMDVANLVAEIS